MTATELTDRYYQPSGEVPGLGYALLAGVAFFGPILPGGIYGYLTQINPIIYLTFIGTIIFGVILGSIISWAGTKGKVRNGNVGGLFGVLAGLVGAWWSWVIYFPANPDYGWEAFSLDPGVVFGNMTRLSEEGIYEFFGFIPASWQLWLLWIIELGLILLMAWSGPNEELTTTPFCENCDQWTEKDTAIARLMPCETEMLKMALEQNHYEVLTQLPSASPQEKAYLDLDLNVCTACRNNCFLTIKSTEISIDKEGKEEIEQVDVVRNLMVPAEVVETVRGI